MPIPKSYRVSVVANGEGTPAQRLYTESGALPATVTLAVASAVKVWLFWAEQNPGNSPIVPSASDVVNNGFPLLQGQQIVLDWNPNDSQPHDPSLLFLAVEGEQPGDLRMLS